MDCGSNVGQIDLKKKLNQTPFIKIIYGSETDCGSDISDRLILKKKLNQTPLQDYKNFAWNGLDVVCVCCENLTYKKKKKKKPK